LDDEVCSQSLKFSWIINTLYEVDGMIEQNITAWDTYHERFIRPSLCMEQVWTEVDKDKLCRKIARCNEMRSKLSYMQKGFRDQRSRALALREGVRNEPLQLHSKKQAKLLANWCQKVFLASSILGARASTRLGENVQLLTFVSIFYLPLSFCAVSYP
jgi:hypothetical protein